MCVQVRGRLAATIEATETGRLQDLNDRGNQDIGFEAVIILIAISQISY